MSPPRGNCEQCGEPVTTVDTASFRVRGFEDEREGGGANKIRHRERQPNRIWHARCVDKWVREHSGGGEQGSLL